MSGSKHAERAKTGTTGAPPDASVLRRKNQISRLIRVDAFGGSTEASGIPLA